MVSTFFDLFCIFFGGGGQSVLATSLLMSPFCIFERCLDSNPESCHRSTLLRRFQKTHNSCMKKCPKKVSSKNMFLCEKIFCYRLTSEYAPFQNQRRISLLLILLWANNYFFLRIKGQMRQKPFTIKKCISIN